MTLHSNQVAMLESAIAATSTFSQPVQTTLGAFFRKHSKLGSRDRGLVANGVFAYVRRRRSLEARTTEPRKLSFLVLAQELRLEPELLPLISTDERLWLEQHKMLPPSTPPAVMAELPDWLWQKLGGFMDAVERMELARSWLTPAPVDLRTNFVLTKRVRLQAMLSKDGIRSEATRYSPFGLRMASKRELAHHPLFQAGHFEIQDEGSQLIGLLVAPRRGELVVDFCAGGGGKTLLLGALMHGEGHLYAFDSNEKRLTSLGPRLQRARLNNVLPQRIAHEQDAKLARFADKMDRVLVDAPCSGFGTLRRNPDLKWRYSEQKIREFAALQIRILTAAARLVRRGGRLVYATCSVLPEENQNVADRFLAGNADFHLLDANEVLMQARIPLTTGRYFQVWPHRHGCDGFFAAVLERRAA